MANEPALAADRFEEYYSEKLWEIIPAFYKSEDGSLEAATPGVLRGLIEVFAGQAAILRRSQDRLWEDQFVELADDWVIPYIADLVGTRLLAAQNRAGRRVDVAKTIYYRRRKGTLAVLEELISDIARWEGNVIESYSRMARTRHLLDPPPTAQPGRLSGTLPGGFADLRHAHAAETVYGPFDEFHHTPDLRRQRGLDGRYGIEKLAFHLFRLRVFRVEGATPHLVPGSGTRFTIDPSGRDAPIFMPRNREFGEEWHSALRWELPAPIPTRLLNDAQFAITERVVQDLAGEVTVSGPSEIELRRLRGLRFHNEERFRETLSSLPDVKSDLLNNAKRYRALATLALAADCAKAVLLRADEGSAGGSSNYALRVVESGSGQVRRQEIEGADLSDWKRLPPKRRLLVDAEAGRLKFVDAPDGDLSLTYHYGLSGEIGAGTYDRRQDLTASPDTVVLGGGSVLNAGAIHNDGVTEIADSATYTRVSDKLNVANLTVQAANSQRPYLQLCEKWVLNTGSNRDARATLDGLWVGGSPTESDDKPGVRLILKAEGGDPAGTYERVILRNCTLDPGGKTGYGWHLPPFKLVIDCRVEELCVLNSIIGRIEVTGQGAIEKLEICDSIVDSINPATPAIETGLGEVHISRSTVLGSVSVHRLWASECLITGRVEVTDAQAGCFRFSAAPNGSVLPSPYETYSFAESRHFFTSTRFGDPGYGQLSERVPTEISRGGESGSEMGAFNRNAGALRIDALQTKVHEYMPFGLAPLFIRES